MRRDSPDLVLTTRDGVRVACDVYGPADAALAVVLAPGFWRRRTSPVLADFAAALAKGGRRVFLFSFRGHGDSSGAYTFGHREGADLEAVLAAALEERPGRRAAVVGFSLGGSIAVRMLAERPALKSSVSALITVGTPSDLRKIRVKILKIPEALPHLSLYEAARPPRVSLSAYARPPAPFEESAPFVSPVPLVVMHSKVDWLVGVEHAERLFAAAREPRRLVIFPCEEAMHADTLIVHRSGEFLKAVEEALGGT
jgi:pimeloyl-ACP methyl ester carboxylesterase